MKTNDQALSTLYKETDIYVIDRVIPLVSYFKPPINARNPTPVKDVSLKQIYNAIKGDFFKSVTLQANKHYQECGGKPWPGPRGEQNPFRRLKTSKLHYVTFGGTFSQRGNQYLTQASGYYCFDLDHLKNIDKERERILAINDQHFKTRLIFTSPSGKGLKWIISIADNQHDYTQNYKGLQQYLSTQYNIKETDNTQDIARACFLCHDQKAYYHGNI